MKRIRVTSDGKLMGYIEGTFTDEEAVQLCTDMEYVFLDVDGSAYDMEIVPA